MIRQTFTIFAFLLLFVSCAGRHEIVTEIDEKQANEILVFLASYGVDAQKQPSSGGGAGGMGGGDQVPTWTITVPASQATEALSILNKAGLPRRPGPSLLNIFKKSGLVSSAQEEQIRYQEGLAEQIAGTIRMIDGVVDAVVAISFPATEPGTLVGEEKKEAVRASVYVKHTGVLDNPNSQLVTKIQRLVAASVGGLDFDNVTVISDRARFADVSLEEKLTGTVEEEREYRKVWSVIVWKGSVERFRLIFMVLTIAIFVLAAFTAWMLWKLFPLLQQAGGLGQLFTSVAPLYPGGVKPKKKKKGEEEEEEEEYEEEE